MQIIKRNNSKENFDISKIENALKKCLHEIGDDDISKAKEMSKDICEILENSLTIDQTTSVEQVQDIVENYLLDKNYYEAYEAYAKFRKEREVIRRLKDKIPEDVKQAFKESKQYFPSVRSEIQFYDKMSRFDHDKGRRETWVETVKERVVPFFRNLSKNKLSEKDYSDIEKFIIQIEGAGSFRNFAMAGAAAERDNTCCYNCAYHAIDNLDAFAEDLFISMCGTGIGYSVESYYISKLPKVEYQDYIKPKHIFVIKDSTEGWCNALDFGIKSWFKGEDVDFIYDEIRPAGSILKTKGGRASGPEPLKNSMGLIREIILKAQGRKLFSDEIADIINISGDCAMMGGMRRTAKIGIVDFGDQRMRDYKKGNIYDKVENGGKPWRGNSNISEAFTDEYSYDEIKRYVEDMHASGRGENGIFSRINAVLNAPKRRIEYWEEKLGFKITKENAVLASFLLRLGVNPCGEIILSTFCNLSVAVARKGLSYEELAERVRIATIIGVIQSMATHFPYLRDFWKKVTEEERLLGVDIIGHADFGLLPVEWQKNLKQLVLDTAEKYAKTLEINFSNSTTTGKPGGNSSNFFDASAGIARRKYAFNLRNIEVNINTPTFKVLKHSKVPGFPKPNYENTTYIFSIPCKAPEGALLQKDETLKSQLDYWTEIKTNYTEHNPSCTIHYTADELPELIDWIYNNQNLIGGLTFLEKFDSSNNKQRFKYLPIQEITEEEYNERISEFPDINWELLWIFEKEDHTTSSREIACGGDKCEIA